jgi:hypothetical protein
MLSAFRQSKVICTNVPNLENIQNLSFVTAITTTLLHLHTFHQQGKVAIGLYENTKSSEKN